MDTNKKIIANHRYQLSFRIVENEHKERTYEREFWCDGEMQYSDCISEEQYLLSLDYPDLFRMVEMFSMGYIGVGCKSIEGKNCIWDMRDGSALKERPRARELSALLDKKASKAFGGGKTN